MQKLIDMTGERYGKLVVISRATWIHTHDTKWLCKCDCGKQAVVSRRNLIKGLTKSCGCSKGEFIRAARKTHGMKRTRLYRIWSGVKDRCLNPKSKVWDKYGGIGIILCKAWENSFETFRDWALENGYSDSLTLDRIDNDGGYCPGNCRWATYKVQENNRGNNRIIVRDGVAKTASEWAYQYDIDPKLFISRLCKGWDVEDALNREVKKTRQYEYNGENLTSAEWSERLGSPNKRLVEYRIERYGWKVEKAVTTPPKQTGGNANV